MSRSILSVCILVLLFSSLRLCAQNTNKLTKDEKSEGWDELIENSKFKSFPRFTEGIAKDGYIGLQDHGYTVWFRNIKIRVLD